MKKLYYTLTALLLFGVLSAAVAQMGLTTQPGMMVTGATASSFSGSRDFPGGADDYVTVSDDASLQFGTGDFAVSFWMRPDSASSGDLWSKHANFSLYFFGGDIRARVGNSTQFTVASTIATGVWSHVVMTRSGTTVKSYLNGVETDDRSRGSSLDYSGGDVRIGGTDPVNGLIADCRVYDVALSAGDVTDLYSNGRASTVHDSDRVLHLPLSDGPEYLTDQSGEGNDGTTSGTLPGSALEP